MKTFKRHRSLKELRAILRKKRWPLSTKKFNEGSDLVSFRFQVGRVSGTCLFNTVNGRFFGETKSGQTFSSDDWMLDDKPWFRSLLNTAYVA